MSSLPSITWLETVKSYLDKRLLWVFMLGCSSGFPWVLIGSNMSGWLKDAGLTLSAIGYFGSVFAVYAINFLWAPLVDRIKLPVLHRLLGQRRSWIFLCQSIVLVATLFIAGVNPAENLIFTSMLALCIATASATQDIAIDAFRIDTFPKTEESKLPQASAMAVIGWWTGYSLPGYLAFINADGIGWNGVYYGMAFIVVLLMIFTLLVGEPKHNVNNCSWKQSNVIKKSWAPNWWLGLPLPLWNLSWTSSIGMAFVLPSRFCYLFSYSKLARRFWDACRLPSIRR